MMNIRTRLERLEQPKNNIYAGLADRLRLAKINHLTRTPEETQIKIRELEKRGDKLSLRIARALQR